MAHPAKVMLSALRIGLLGMALIAGAQAVEPVKRSAAVRSEFQRHNPCPATGKRQGRCPGYEIDHVHALCAGGPDRAENLQWLTVEEHSRKTRVDVRECRRQRSQRTDSK